MNQAQRLRERFSQRPLLLNIILDGYGLGKRDDTDAVFLAKTPVMDRLLATYAQSQILTHGPYVGLPGATDLGGSEVGHLTLGAGMILDQGPTMINKALASGKFFELATLHQLMRVGREKSLHLLGLLSDGNVHSHINHFIALIQEAAKRGVERLYLHALFDGRDVAIQSADQYVEQIEAVFARIRQDHPTYDYRFASAGGREVITMDRDKNWSKVQKGYETHVLGQAGTAFPSALEGILYYRGQQPDLVDQDMPPYNITGSQGDIPRMHDGDALLFVNFRADRAAQFAQVMDDPNFVPFPLPDRPQMLFCGMCVYDEDTNLPKHILMGSPEVAEPFGRRILELNKTQFRLAETQKFAHVTFFFNGGYRNPLNPEKEEYKLIPSDKINNFALAPQMKALEIAAQAKTFIHAGTFDYGLINFANADMVGHTGDLKAAVAAVETVDTALGQVLAALEAKGGVALITADHGNADEMLIFNKKTGKMERSTKHSINPVPVVIFDPGYDGSYHLKPCDQGEPNTLAMVAATNYILMGREIPPDLAAPLILL